MPGLRKWICDLMIMTQAPRYILLASPGVPVSRSFRSSSSGRLPEVGNLVLFYVDAAGHVIARDAKKPSLL